MTEQTVLQTNASTEVASATSVERSLYSTVLTFCAGLFTLIALLFVGNLVWRAWPILSRQPLTLVTGTSWGGTIGSYGAWPQIFGTLQTSVGAVIIAVIAGLGTSISIVYLIPQRVKLITITLVELLAAVPSIVYGCWGFLILGPYMTKYVDPALAHLPFAKYWLGNPNLYTTQSVLLGIFVLAVMVLPTFVAISREVIASVPNDLIEASYSLGGSWWQTMSKVVLPASKIGIFGAASLALARAAGETVAILFIIGGFGGVQTHLLYPGSTLAAWIASQFGEATTSGIAALMAMGVLLMIINFLLAIISRRMLAAQRRRMARV